MSKTRPDAAAAALCGRLLDDVDGLGARLTRLVRAEIRGYASLAQVEHEWNVRDTAAMLLHGLAEGRGPTADQLRFIETATLRRAHQGIQVHEVIASFHICARAIWDELRLAAATEATLVSLAGPLWDWIHALASAVADVYTDAAGRMNLEAAVQRQRFIELLRTGAPDAAAPLARELGFDSAGQFTAFASPVEQWAHGLLEPLHRELQRRPGKNVAALQGRRMFVISQGADADLAEVIAGLGGQECRIGVGLTRNGMRGAAESMSDAELASNRTRPNRRIVEFETEWLRATLADAGERLAPLLRPAERVASEHPDLAETVLAYSESGFSAKATAERLHLHANTVAYRLNRWHELSGLDPRSFDGMIRSVVALDQ